ncbi:MAG: hypothetical protein HYX48_05755 [Chlamydiales bacterium]|nr:hypothetical protein [Chlamydiales bacterium]
MAMKFSKRIILNTGCTLLCLFAIERFCRWQTAGFRLDKLHSDFVFHPSLTASKEEASFGSLLQQRFTFLGSGVQCYAFLGEDNETVLKVFKHYHNMPITGLVKTIPLPSALEKWRDSIRERRERRLNAIFSSCEIAGHEFKEETGVIGIHLEPTTSLKQKITLIDKLGITHEIDADTTAFVLQKRVEMLPEKIGPKEEMQKRLKSLVELIAMRCKKGVLNLDLRIERNIGFIGDRAIEVDIGSYKKQEPKRSSHPYRKEVKRELSRLREWTEEHYPELLADVDHEIEAAIQNF